MNDPFGSMQGFLNQFRGFAMNPMQYLMQRRLNIPQGMSDPNQIIQHLLNTGAMTQEQYNGLRKAADQIQGNPQFIQMMGGNGASAQGFVNR